MFITGNRPQMAEWVFDPRSRHISPANDTAAGLCLSDADLPALAPQWTGSATVTPIGSRFSQAPAEPESRPEAEPVHVPAAPRSAAAEQGSDAEQAPALERPARKKAAGGRPRRSSVPSWDEIMFGTSRQPD